MIHFRGASKGQAECFGVLTAAGSILAALPEANIRDQVQNPHWELFHLLRWAIDQTSGDLQGSWGLFNVPRAGKGHSSLCSQVGHCGMEPQLRVHCPRLSAWALLS